MKPVSPTLAKEVASELYRLISADVRCVAEKISIEMNDCWMSSHEAANYMQVSLPYIRKHIKELPHVKMGNSLRFKKTALNAWLERKSKL